MVSFDWAMKRLLRNKANFEVLEGFLSELLRRKIIVKNICESESNQDVENEKGTRVDLLAEADDRELVIIEVQYHGEAEYFHRILYGVSKVITNHLMKGQKYSNVRKVYSINIVYFDLGEGDDYIYHGFTEFKGLHTQTDLKLSEAQHEIYGKTFPGEFYPEYYLIKLGNFNEVAKNTLDEWVYYLKNNQIRDDFTAQGIGKAREILAYDNMSDEDKAKYDRAIDMRLYADSQITTAHLEGKLEGINEARVEAEATARKMLEETVHNARKAGCSLETIASITKLTVSEINQILEHGQQGTFSA